MNIFLIVECEKYLSPKPTNWAFTDEKIAKQKAILLSREQDQSDITYEIKVINLY